MMPPNSVRIALGFHDKWECCTMPYNIGLCNVHATTLKERDQEGAELCHHIFQHFLEVSESMTCWANCGFKRRE